MRLPSLPCLALLCGLLLTSLAFARQVAGRPEMVQLTTLDSQRDWTAELDAMVRRIVREEAADGSGRLATERSFAERLAEAEMEIQALEMIELQVLSDLSKGRNPGAASSAMKIRGSETSQKILSGVGRPNGQTPPTGWPVRAANDMGVTNSAPADVSTLITSAPDFFSRRTSSSAL